MTTQLTDSEIEGFNRRGYSPDEQVSLLTDALYYDEEGKYFHTVDGRFAQVWMLGMIDKSTISQADEVEAANQFARILAEFPYGASGQVLRHTHRGIEGLVESFGAERADHPFGDAIIDSFVDRQYQAALSSKGFFANISPRMIEQARQEEEDATPEADRRGSGIELIERSTSTGTYPYVSELYLVMLWEPPKSAIGMVANYFQNLLAGAGLLDIERKVEREYMKQRRLFQSLSNEVTKTINTTAYRAALVNGQGLLDFVYRLLNPVRAYQTPSPIYRGRGAGGSSGIPVYQSGYTIGDHLALRVNPDHKTQNKSIRQKAGFQPIEPDEQGFKWPYTVNGQRYYYYGRVTSVGGLPAAHEPGLIQNALADIEGESLVTLNFYITPKLAVEGRLWARQKQVDLAGNVGNPNSEIHQRRVEDLESIKTAVASDNVYSKQRMMDVSVHCCFFGFDGAEVEDRAMKAQRALFDEGIHETVRGDAVMHHSFPLNYRPSSRDLLQRDQPVLSGHAGRLAPIFVEYQGVESPAVMVNNRNGTPIFIDPFGTQTKTAHSLVCGSTGTGKSFAFNQLLMTLMAKYRPKIWLIDKGRSYESLCHALDGTYIELVQDEEDGLKPTCMNPFYIPPNEDGSPRAPSMEEKEFLCNWLIAAIKAGIDGAEIHSSTISLLSEAIKEFYEGWPRGSEATMSDFMKHLRNKNFSDLSGVSIAEKLSLFYDGGPYAKLFDGPSDVDWSNDFIVLETERMSSSRALPVAMLSTLRQIEQYAKYKLPRNRRKIIGVDEAWNTIANKEAANALGGFFRELRKYKTGVFLISQALTDFLKLVKAEGGAEDGILVNTSHFYLLACTDADYQAAKKELSFSDEEVAAWSNVSSLPPFFSEVFYRQRMKSDNFESGVFRIYSAPVPLWLATTDSDDVEMRNDLVIELIDDGLDGPEARRRAVQILADRYPYGSRYQIDDQEGETHAA